MIRAEPIKHRLPGPMWTVTPLVELVELGSGGVIASADDVGVARMSRRLLECPPGPVSPGAFTEGRAVVEGRRRRT